MKTVCVIGEGAWGTAVATILAHNGYQVNLWCHDNMVAEEINAQHVNERYLTGVTLSENIYAVTDLEQALHSVEWVFEAIPVKYLRSVLEQVKPFYNLDQKWVILSKGIERETLLLPTEIITDVFGEFTKQLILSGPSFAREVAQKKLTGMMIAAPDNEYALELKAMISNNYIVASFTIDSKGVQIAGAFKNVLALGNGLLKGYGFKDNTQALFLTRGLQEMEQLVKHLAGNLETVYGLAGIGDLILTAMSEQSRNVQVGMRLSGDTTLQQIIEETGYTPEGINTVQSMHQLLQNNNIKLPLCESIYEVIFNNKSVDKILTVLMQ